MRRIKNELLPKPKESPSVQALQGIANERRVDFYIEKAVGKSGPNTDTYLEWMLAHGLKVDGAVLVSPVDDLYQSENEIQKNGRAILGKMAANDITPVSTANIEAMRQSLLQHYINTLQMPNTYSWLLLGGRKSTK